MNRFIATLSCVVSLALSASAFAKPTKIVKEGLYGETTVRTTATLGVVGDSIPVAVRLSTSNPDLFGDGAKNALGVLTSYREIFTAGGSPGFDAQATTFRMRLSATRDANGKHVWTGTGRTNPTGSFSGGAQNSIPGRVELAAVGPSGVWFSNFAHAGGQGIEVVTVGLNGAK